MYTLITHIKTKEEYYMSYLDNLTDVPRGCVILSKPSIEYLKEVFEECERFIRTNYQYYLNARYYIDDHLLQIDGLIDVKPVCIPMYDHSIREMILNEKDIMDIYNYAYTHCRYLTDAEYDRYLNIHIPDERDYDEILRKFAHEDLLGSITGEEGIYGTKGIDKLRSYTDNIELLLAMIGKYDSMVITAIDIFSDGYISDTVEEIVRYMCDVHDIFRYMRVYQVSKEETMKIKQKRVYDACDEYLYYLIKHVTRAIAIIAKHEHLDEVPESLNSEDLERYVNHMKAKENKDSPYRKTYFGSNMVKTYESYDLWEPGPMHYLRVGNNKPTFANVCIYTAHRIKYAIPEIRKAVRESGYPVYHSLYQMIADMADQSVEKSKGAPGSFYFELSSIIDNDDYDLERFTRPHFKLYKRFVSISNDRSRGKYTKRRINQYHDRRVFRPLEPYHTEGFSKAPSDYISMDMKDVIVDGKSYKFENVPLVDMDSALGTKRTTKHKLTICEIADLSDRSCGLQSVNFRPLDEFGEPDRSDWEPRRNNWNQ